MGRDDSYASQRRLNISCGLLTAPVAVSNNHPLYLLASVFYASQLQTPLCDAVLRYMIRKRADKIIAGNTPTTRKEVNSIIAHISKSAPFNTSGPRRIQRLLIILMQLPLRDTTPVKP